MADESGTGNGHGVTFQKLVEDLKVVVQDSEELLKTSAGQLRQKAFAGAKYTDEGIRRNPYPSMGIVFGLGLLLGILSYNLISSGARQLEEENG
ncbi:MAG: hypothetical protein JWR26_4342 [Pedosphaera sp.]|nr:hypothetical protein [Pedosphaera sp.]